MTFLSLGLVCKITITLISFHLGGRSFVHLFHARRTLSEPPRITSPFAVTSTFSLSEEEAMLQLGSNGFSITSIIERGG